MKQPLPVNLTDAEIEELGRELDAIYEEVKQSLGDDDRAYIRRLIRTQRSMALGGRLAIFGSLPLWPATWPLYALGTATLGLAKILENMEIGHNVMHGQWDWMGDPEIQASTWEWDSVCPSDQWKYSHNVVHHTWTNVLGKDRDVGYGILRMADEQAWKPRHVFQPVANALLATFFEVGVALHDIEFERIESGEKTLADAMPLLRRVGEKAKRQALKDYVLWPLLSGPFFFHVAGANFTANVIRNLWAYTIIFCGHFPEGVHLFSPEQIEGESRGAWYVRQLLGSCNIEGSKLFHILSGNLSHQIEHHLFPDMPSNRYPEVAPRVRALAARYGLPYNSGRLTKQFGSTLKKVFRLSLPSRTKSRTELPQPEPTPPLGAAA